MTPLYFHFVIFSILISIIVASKRGPLAEGFYKITNAEDGSVLTATNQPGPYGPRPRKVITSVWVGSDAQEWKIKTRVIDGESYDIIRNEKIRDNEVTKEKNYDKSVNKNDYVQTSWNLISVGKGRSAGYELNNGVLCLKGNGAGNEIKYAECLESDEVDNSYLWRFEYIRDIPSSEAAIETE